MRSGLLLLAGALIASCSSAKMATVDGGPTKMMGGDARVDSADDAPMTMTGADAGADAGVDSTDCKKAWGSPGCGDQAPAPTCDDGRGGACGSAVCDCQSKVHLTACDRSDVPFNYRLSTFTPLPVEGTLCTPAPDAGHDH